MSRLTVAMPKARDGRDRAPSIPASVLAKRAAAAAAAAGAMEVEGGEGVGAGVQPTRKTEKDLMWENGGPGVYSCDYRKYYDLKARAGRGGGKRGRVGCLCVLGSDATRCWLFGGCSRCCCCCCSSSSSCGCLFLPVVSTAAERCLFRFGVGVRVGVVRDIRR